MDDFIPTRVSKIKGDSRKEFVSVNYEKPKKRKAEVFNERIVQETDVHENIDERRKQELEMKRLRYEVIKFGMSGLKGMQAKKANVALAVSLGAKPPPKKVINYKLLQEQRKRQKETLRQKQNHDSTTHKTKHKTAASRKNDSDGILKIYGTVNKKSPGRNKK